MNFVQYTLNQKTFVDVKESQKTSFIIKGLPLHTTVWVRYRSTGRNKSTEWSTMFEYFVIN